MFRLHESKGGIVLNLGCFMSIYFTVKNQDARNGNCDNSHYSQEFFHLNVYIVRVYRSTLYIIWRGIVTTKDRDSNDNAL